VATRHLPEQEIKRWLSVKMAAAYAGCHAQTVRTLLHSGELRCSDVSGAGRQIRVDRLDLDKLLERRKKFLPRYGKGTRPAVAKRHAHARHEQETKVTA